ncbi:MAG: T9SS type A sorting domain-containing protein, partial [Saprospiraceae bacterium]
SFYKTGNLDTCQMSVTWEEYSGPTQSIACKDSVVFKLEWGDEVLLTPDMIFQDIRFGCANNYSLELFVAGNLRPQPIITAADTNIMLTATTTDPNNGNQCSTRIIVLTNFYCKKPLPVCDVQCHSAPIGDCSSGHSDQDEVEWPCDITITGACPFNELYPDPDILIWYGLADSADVYPAIDFSQCLSNGYYDQEMVFPTEKIIQRNWTIIDWESDTVYEYIQNITLEYDLTEICDTLPWNSPTGNCGSGHTLTDDVEWPADITVHSLFSKPEDLAHNSEVLSQNVRPQVSTGCNVAETTYSDILTGINDTTLLVERKWNVQDVKSLEVWQYIQNITLIRKGDGSLVCVTRENGKPIPDVELIPGVFTDLTGCHFFENPAGIIVTPVKDSPIDEGVNILDEIAIEEYLLGIRTLSEYQQYAADLNHNLSITAIDVVEIDKIIKGTFIPPLPHNWTFYEENTKEHSVDISNTLASYKFIGVKKGDVVTAPGEEEIFLHASDEVLNNGETYEIPFYLDRHIHVKGFGIEISNPGNNLEFLDVTTPQFSEFSFAQDAHVSNGSLRMVWIASPAHFATGFEILENQPFFVLRLKANENVILHDALLLGIDIKNEFIPPSTDSTFIFRLFWDGVIVSSTVDIGNGRTLEFYPNPVTNVIHFKGLSDQENVIITLYDGVGQTILQSSLKESVDLTSLHSGIYYISFFVDGKYSKMVPVVKI